MILEGEIGVAARSELIFGFRRRACLGLERAFLNRKYRNVAVPCFLAQVDKSPARDG